MEEVRKVSQVETCFMYIDGQWVESESGERFEAFNPANRQVIATLPQGTREDARRAIEAANRHKHKIARMSIWDRSRLCHRIAEVMEKRKEELARTLSLDQGKPYFSEALPEVETAINGFHEAAEHIKWLESSFIPVEDVNKRTFTIRQPRGVYAVITPWNFPINIPVEYLAAGLAAGNAIVWVPAPSTSVCAVRLMECMEEAGVPPGVVNLVTGPGPVVGDEIVSHPGTDAVGFTGSTATGTEVARRAAGKPLLLELGGNGPTIILDDADLEHAVRATAMGCFFNAGQVCSSAERILVHPRVVDDVLQGLKDAAAGVVLGDPFQKETTMGPLNNDPVAQKVDRHLEDARQRGAEVVFGGSRVPSLGSDLFYQPTVVTRLDSDSLFNQEETFGPVAPVFTFSSDEEAIEFANRSTWGLVASVFTTNMARAMAFAEGIRTGMVNINDHSNYWEIHLPFGGASGKRSGIGRLGGKYTIMEMTDLKTINIDLRGWNRP